LNGRLMNIAYCSDSDPLDDAECEEEGKRDDLGWYSFHDSNSYFWFKQVQDARIFASTNLGGHVIYHNNVGPWNHEVVNSSPFGIIHFHDRCYSQTVAAAWKAMVGHGYIQETDTPEMVRKKFEERLSRIKAGQDICDVLKADNPKMKKIPGMSASFHKVVIYLRDIHGCVHQLSEVSKHMGATPVGTSGLNPEFAEFLKEYVVGYAK
jgi:hypothetical protein